MNGLMRRMAMMSNAKRLDTDGLIAYFDHEDATRTGWQDRLGNIRFTTNTSSNFGNYNDMLVLNNWNNAARCLFYVDNSYRDFLNSNIDKEFTCFIDGLFQIRESKKALVIDFGALGASASGISLLVALNQNGGISISPKVNGNSSSGFSEKITSIDGDVAFPTDSYTNVLIKCGVRLIDGKQEVYAEALGKKVYALNNTPRTINFQGCGGNNRPFGLGAIYTGDTYATSYRANMIYKRILLYNKNK